MTSFEELISTANVLVDHKNYPEAILQFTSAIDKTDIPEQEIDIYNTIGRLHIALQNTNEAILSFEKALETHQSLSEEKAEKLSVNKATILNNLGLITLNSNVKLAIKHHKEALAIFTKAEEKKPKTFTLHLANTHYSYGDACYFKKDFFMAKKQYKDAITVYKIITDDHSTQPLIANAYYNLGNIYTDEDNVFDARNNYLKALKIFRALAEEQPKAYKSLVAATFNNLAVTAKTMYKYTDAITYYENALKEYEALLIQDRNTFLPFYAATLNSIGIIYTEQHEIKDDYASEGLSGFSGFGTLSVDNIKDEKKEKASQFQKEKAITYYGQAIEIYNELADKEPEVYTHYVATCLHNLGVLYDEKEDYKTAEEHYEKALGIRRFLAEKQPEAFNLDTCVTLLNITTMYQNLLEKTGKIGFKAESLKILKEIEGRLSIYGDSEKPILLSMKSDTQYFTRYFNEIDAEYLDVLDRFGMADAITEKINETLVPIEKLKLQKDIVNLMFVLKEKYPKNKRIQTELLNSYTQYAWFALRSNSLLVAEKAIENGFKIAPHSLSLKANLAHLYLVQNKTKKAKEIYLSIKELHNDENESFKKVLETDLKVLKNDDVLKSQNIDTILTAIIT